MRPPRMKLSAPITSDFPTPVAPLNTFNRSQSFIVTLSINTKLVMYNSCSIVKLPFSARKIKQPHSPQRRKDHKEGKTEVEKMRSWESEKISTSQLPNLPTSFSLRPLCLCGEDNFFGSSKFCVGKISV